MRPITERGIFALVCLNLALQVFDGVATYIGVHAGMAEGNPLLGWALAQVGPGFALLLFNLPACACLRLLWHVRRHRLAAAALAFSPAVHALCPLAPGGAGREPELGGGAVRAERRGPAQHDAQEHERHEDSAHRRSLPLRRARAAAFTPLPCRDRGRKPARFTPAAPRGPSRRRPGRRR